MATITITTDGTVENTKLNVDGKDISEKEKIVSISMYAQAPYKSEYDGCNRTGYVRVSYSRANEDGTVSTNSLHNDNNNSTKGIGQKKITTSDQVIQFVGQPGEVIITSLVDKILTHCKEKDIFCKDREVLLSRSEQSLKDKANDLGIKLEDANV